MCLSCPVNPHSPSISSPAIFTRITIGRASICTRNEYVASSPRCWHHAVVVCRSGAPAIHVNRSGHDGRLPVCDPSVLQMPIELDSSATRSPLSGRRRGKCRGCGFVAPSLEPFQHRGGNRNGKGMDWNRRGSRDGRVVPACGAGDRVGDVGIHTGFPSGGYRGRRLGLAELEEWTEGHAPPFKFALPLVRLSVDAASPPQASAYRFLREENSEGGR